MRLKQTLTLVDPAAFRSKTKFCRARRTLCDTRALPHILAQLVRQTTLAAASNNTPQARRSPPPPPPQRARP